MPAIPNFFTGEGFSSLHLKTIGIFRAHAVQRTVELAQRDGKYVHYTSAEGALSIVKSNCVWLRNALCMNDYLELHHGFECVSKAHEMHKDRFRRVLNGLFDGLGQEVENRFNSWLPQLLRNTYLFSISEHDHSENNLGRLSMWRAYGGIAGVAIVMHGAPFWQPSDALSAYSYPVSYHLADDFAPAFASLIDRIEADMEFVRSLGREIVFGEVFDALASAVACTKHRAFMEEKEWRVIYNPIVAQSRHMQHEVLAVRGVPQSIYKIPLRNVPEERLHGIELNELIERIIIGPCAHPVVLKQAVVRSLQDAGVVDAENRVFESKVPLRL